MLAVSTAAVRHVLAQPHLSSVVWTNRHIVEFAAFSVADGGRGRDDVVAPVFWNEENAISVCGDDIAGCNFKLSERFANSPHRGAAAVPAATALAVNVKACGGDHDRVFELDEAALGVLQRGLDRDHHSVLEGAIGVSDADGRPLGVSPEADRAIRTGTGGLY